MRKIGRCKKKPCQMRYTNEMRWIKNKLRKIDKHLRKYPLDKQARNAISMVGA